jgi:LEA14-like dessication related protein
VKRLSIAVAVFALAACVRLQKPEIAFRGVAIGGIGRDGAAIDVALDVTNPNGYRLGVEQLTYRLTVGGIAAGEGSIESTVSVPAHGTAPVHLPLRLEFGPLKSSALEMALAGGIDYAVDGEVVFRTPLGKTRRPYHHQDRLSFLR